MRLVMSILFVVAFVASGCSFSASVGGSPESAAQDVIEEELAGELALGEIEAECGEPPNDDEGSTFACTSETDRGLIRWEATIVDEDTVNVQSLNFLVGSDVVALEGAAVVELEQVVGTTLGTENFDCGEPPLVLDSDDELVCALTDPANGDVYDTTVIITDTSTGAFEFEVAPEPR
ncbi:MAG: hypothetical protein ACERLM_06625 [Acidimicrobiales bacterium]